MGRGQSSESAVVNSAASGGLNAGAAGGSPSLNIPKFNQRDT